MVLEEINISEDININDILLIKAGEKVPLRWYW
jgi:hypothetical protein